METSKKYNNTKGLLLHLCKQRDYKGIVNLAVESSFSKLDDEAYSLTLEAFCSDPRGTGLGSHFNELLEQASERVRNSASKSFKYRILLLILNLYGTGTIRLFSDKELTSFLSKLQLEHELRCLVNLYI